jgi:hypothetical protein
MAAKQKPSRQRLEAQRLRAAQKAEAAALRQSQRDAIARTRALQATARKRLKAIHKAQRARATQQRRAFRHRAAILKRKGLLRPEIDIRKLSPTRAITRLFKKFAKVLEGKETTYKVPAEKIKELHAQGYTVVDGRIVLTKSLRSRGGKIFAAREKGKRATELQTIKLGKNFEKEIHKAFASLGEGEFIGFRVFGHNSYDLYQVEDPMLDRLKAYHIPPGATTHLTIFRVKNADAYRVERRAEAVKLEQARNKRKSLRRKERKAMLAGMRVTRGH